MAKALPLDQIPVFNTDNKPNPEIDFSNAAIILVNKEKGWSSFDVVKYVRHRLKARKVGHAGTLDPMAVGLLILCSGRATKSISQLQEMPKTYVAEVTLGASTPSYDAESDIDNTADWEHITLEAIETVLKRDFSGDILQVPPMYSALKRDGKRLYELARRGESIELEPRPVTIYSHEILGFEKNKLQLKIECSKGTYIRSIAHDLGKALNSLGHLSALARTQIGEFTSDKALSTLQINELLNAEN